MSLVKHQADCFNLEHIGWKYYNTVRKKAVEQEFSWSGLFISLSIAFFIIIIGAYLLNFIYRSVDHRQNIQSLNEDVNQQQGNLYLS